MVLLCNTGAARVPKSGVRTERAARHRSKNRRQYSIRNFDLYIPERQILIHCPEIYSTRSLVHIIVSKPLFSTTDSEIALDVAGGDGQQRGSQNAP